MGDLVATLRHMFSFRRAAAAAVAAVGIEALLSAATPNLPGRERALGRLLPAAIPSAAHLLALLAALALLVLAPRLWRGTRTAVPLAVGWLAVLALLNLIKGLDYDEAALDGCLLAVLIAGRSAFPLGSRARPRLAAAGLALGAWALSWGAELVRPLLVDRGHTLKLAFGHTLGRAFGHGVGRALGHALTRSLAGARPDAGWTTIIELLLGCAVLASLLALRSWTAPTPDPGGHSQEEHRAARALLARHGQDSISPFILRPDKSFHFAGEGVVAYRVIGGTCVVSGDPVAPPEEVPAVLCSLLSLARRRGWRVVIWGSSERHLGGYARLGLRAIRLGEEAFVDPSTFTLEGRRVRKLRQSVNRLARRGWRIEAHEGRQLDDRLEGELDALEERWRAAKRRIHGFAMGMGSYTAERWPDDLYLLARAPSGELRAVMHFISHCGRLSLDTMHRVGETPNGLNEAMICRALEIARERGVPEVSLNYAGLGHLVRRGAAGRGAVRVLARLLSTLIGARFQMAGLVRFDEKFSPRWRPRYLVYESAATLPVVALRVLQAEGYLPGGWRPGGARSRWFTRLRPGGGGRRTLARGAAARRLQEDAVP